MPYARDSCDRVLDRLRDLRFDLRGRGAELRDVTYVLRYSDTSCWNALLTTQANYIPLPRRISDCLKS